MSNNSSFRVARKRLSITRAAMTDNTDATGRIDFPANSLPAGAIVLGWKATVTTGFTGDTTAVIQVGVSGDLDRFSALTTRSVLAAGVVASVPAVADGGNGAAAAQTPRVTVTGGADFTNIAAGAMVVEIYYIAR